MEVSQLLFLCCVHIAYISCLTLKLTDIHVNLPSRIVIYCKLYLHDTVLTRRTSDLCLSCCSRVTTMQACCIANEQRLKRDLGIRYHMGQRTLMTLIETLMVPGK